MVATYSGDADDGASGDRAALQSAAGDPPADAFRPARAGADPGSGSATFKIVVNPLVSWIWIGFLVLSLGTAIAGIGARGSGQRSARGRRRAGGRFGQRARVGQRPQDLRFRVSDAGRGRV